MIDVADAIALSANFRAHPLGFYYLQKHQSDGTSFRVHVWLPDGSKSPENDNHQHSFDIHSSIRLGRMRSELVRFIELPNGEEVEFVVDYGKARTTLLPTGRLGKLETTAVFESSAGDNYYLQAGVVHRVAVVEKPCVTFLRTVEKGAPILSYGKEVEEPPFDRTLVTQEERAAISALLEAVGSRVTAG
ncbi:MAG: hypothetical protein ACOH2L_18035 [Devosia sp.]